jgi:hypothetical protein
MARCGAKSRGKRATASVLLAGAAHAAPGIFAPCDASRQERGAISPRRARSAPRSYPLIHRHPPAAIRRVWRGSEEGSAREAATDRGGERRDGRSIDECSRARDSSARERMTTGETNA